MCLTASRRVTDELPPGSLGSDWSLRRPPAGPRGGPGRRRSGVSFESLSSVGDGPTSQRSSLENISRASYDAGAGGRSSVDAASRSSLEAVPTTFALDGRRSADVATAPVQVRVLLSYCCYRADICVMQSGRR